MKSRFVIGILLLAATAASALAAVTADDVAQRAVEMAGGPAWEKARYFAFTFNLDRADGTRLASFPQRWDRQTGAYRVSGVDPQGKKFEVVMNVQTKEGKAWLDGVEAKGDKLSELLQLGYRRFQNDTFWLLTPQRLLEPQVKRVYDGTKDDACNRSFDILRLTYEQGFGFGPNDVFWAWVDRDTGLIAYWDMKLTAVKDEKPVTVTFKEYRRAGGLLISARRDITSKNQIVRLENIEVLPEPPKGAFQ